ncbi:MAG: MBL fold metallo-hydrolase [Sphingomonadales bacterium]|jgi:glyoxylase-like metal-dependent hydrolase (beta-lactamase superfamily II)
MVHFQCFEFSPFAENTYVITGTNGQCLIVDPGCYGASEEIQLTDYITANGLTPVALLNTHGHIDHIFGNHYVKNKWNVPMYLSQLDIPLFERAESMAALWNLKYTPSPLPDEDLHSGELVLAGITLEVRHVPGHAPGHMVFIHHESKTVVCGDTLFQGSIGRTDLPGGNHDLLLKSIREQLFSLPDDYQLLSGHGPASSVGEERAHNPFF